MGVATRKLASRLALWAVPLAALLAVLWGHGAGTGAQAQSGAQMALSASGSGVSCDGDQCSVPLGGSFTLSVEVVSAPEQGYILMQTFINYGSDLTYAPTEASIDEVIWPDSGGEDITLRGETGPGLVNHGALTSLLPPQPISTYTGTVVQLAMECSDSFSETDVQLLPANDAIAGRDGALFTYLEGTQTIDVVPDVNTLTVLCGDAPTAEPGDDGQPTALPPSGTDGGISGDDGLGAGVWAIIVILAFAGVAGIGLFGWRVARARQL